MPLALVDGQRRAAVGQAARRYVVDGSVLMVAVAGLDFGPPSGPAPVTVATVPTTPILRSLR